MSDQNETLYMPEVEDNIPLPKNAREAMPDLSPSQEVKMRANTIKLISDMKGDVIEPNAKNMEEAEMLAEEMMTKPEFKRDYSQYPNETMAYLAGMVAQTQVQLTKDLADYKMYVLNNAVLVSETTKSHREKLSALRMIGEMDGVDAFKKKTEITHVNKTGQELEEELKKAIEDLKGKVIEGEIVDESTENS